MPADWKTSREAQDATAEWAISNLRGCSSAQERLERLTMMVVNYKLPVTADELNKWCHRFEHPDIASGLALKDTEGQAKVIEHLAITQAAEAHSDESTATENADDTSRYRAEGFRTFAELVAPQESVSWHYPPAKRIKGADGKWQGSYARDKDGKSLVQMRTKTIGKGATWKCIEGGGTVHLANGTAVPYLTSVTIGIRDGEIIWALPEVGPKRLWEKKGRGELNYQVKVVTTTTSPHVIGVRAMALARSHAPGAVDNVEGAEMARKLGLKSRQLMFHHETTVEREVLRRRANGTISAR